MPGCSGSRRHARRLPSRSQGRPGGAGQGRSREGPAERRAAVEGLGLLKAPAAVEPLIGILDEEPDADAAKARELAWLKCRTLAPSGHRDRRAVEPALKVLASGNETLRDASAECLGKLGDDRALEPLIKALQSAKPGGRTTIITALGTLGDERAAPACSRSCPARTGSNDPGLPPS